MPYFEPTPVAITYWCPNCSAYYRLGTQVGVQMACAVMHEPGSCCHLHEERVKPVLREDKTTEWVLDQ